MLIKAAIYAVTFLLALFEFCCGVITETRITKEEGNWLVIIYALAAGCLALQFHHQVATLFSNKFGSRSNLLFFVLFFLGFATSRSIFPVPVIMLASALIFLLMALLHNELKFWRIK